ncbi:DEAD/DEAH box helicase [Corynebacterium sp. 320]|uniref:DEAD/DEAH box helicase n=1 Tax=Corynebacterium zhongnanshanii TaxID=2768834 RepID=A0ABQ6VGX3_9CORY|nr:MULTISPECIES: DEAD/DEAH box helicase [Corynebacterium]KAB1504520.1 DEAD/DEAH box helicase [Corynebacterium sp. 320]KAB1553420.1 DEAD/DEAH box helicase [Corynebacterium sp. 321]KAB1554471.1 DEAD/DEAH box helicase [Corynebacterium sp. 319]KAB3523667.1 DEAD/DEAH box helicase [Corynebacterium zhongnanshanii]KAB3528656.1 DEAD/DEAH box helicase [Corynebacterium sp. 250]
MDHLRLWQREALQKYLEDNPQDFLAVATPGAGKTTFALTTARLLLDTRVVQRIVIVVPTEHLKLQWSLSAAAQGISIDPSFSNSSAFNQAFDGVAVTYAQVGMKPTKHYQVATAQKTLVILDEIHHAGDAKSWGDGVRFAYAHAERRLALTGTPFRSDDAQIPFVRYEDIGGGGLQSSADYTYGYSEALKDGVVRPVVFLTYSGTARWRNSAGEEFEARLGEPLNAEQTARAWRTALDPRGDWIPAVLQAAHTRLQQLREHTPDAGGLVIASDKQTARAYAKILEQLSSTPVTVVLSDEAGASDRIKQFNDNQDEWLVAVRMVSEGVDVPRLAVGVYATSASTPLFFAQAIGRFVRSRRPGESASVFLPSVPVLLELASKMEKQRNHVLANPDRPSDGLDDDLLAAANREQNEPGEERGYESVGAEAELDSLIFDGSTYGTATMAGSAEEQDYLGLPGLLDAEQMRTLLRQRQQEQLDARERDRKAKLAEEQERAAKKAEAAAEEGSGANLHARRVASQELPALRKELNTLVSMTAARTGKPHGAIHNEVRRNCGGPATALCTAEQLRDRIAYLRRW